MQFCIMLNFTDLSNLISWNSNKKSSNYYLISSLPGIINWMGFDYLVPLINYPSKIHARKKRTSSIKRFLFRKYYFFCTNICRNEVRAILKCKIIGHELQTLIHAHTNKLHNKIGIYDRKCDWALTFVHDKTICDDICAKTSVQNCYSLNWVIWLEILLVHSWSPRKIWGMF